MGERSREARAAEPQEHGRRPARAHRAGRAPRDVFSSPNQLRAWELAEDLVRRPTLLLRYTRLLFTEYLRRQMHDLLGYGLAMESLALFEKPEAPPG